MTEDRDELFGKLCVEHGYLTPDQLAEAKDAQKAAAGLGMELGLPDVLVSKKLLTNEHREEVMRILRVQTGEARVVGGYEVVAKIGEGGMGVVYKARNTSSGEYVALKVLPPSLARQGTLLKRFRREAAITSTLEHENIVRCVELGFDRERKLHYCALELIKGEDLAERIRREGALPEPEALEITRQIARAIEHASSLGLIHRDIKPQNVMLTPEGTAKLLDLGLAKSVTGRDTRLTQTGTFAGSPHYASPEQAHGERDIDVRTDIYSLGAMLYHMVTGQTPFSGDSAAAVLAQVVSGRLAWPADANAGVSESACWLIAKMTMKDPADRYQTPAELLQDVELAMAGKGLPVFELVRGRSSIMRPGTRGVRAAIRRTGAYTPVQAKARAGRLAAYIAGALGVAAFAVAAAFLLSGGGEREVRPRSTASPREAKAGGAPYAKSGALAERERKLEEMFEFAEKYSGENQDQFQRTIKYFERVREEGRGTRFELMADSRIAEVRKRWREAALVAFEAAATDARTLAARGDVDGALAEVRALPAHLAAQVDDELRDESERILEAGRRKIARALTDAEESLAAPDTARARSVLAGLDAVRFTQGKTAARARIEALRAKIDAAEKAKTAAAYASARDALPRLLAEFEKLLDEGGFASARRRMQGALAERSNASIAETLRAASRVAEALQGRREAIKRAAQGLVGQTVTLKTVAGVRKGELEKVEDEGLTLATKVIINRQVRGVTRFTVGWAELSPQEEDGLAGDWRPTPLARAFVALAREDARAAEDALRSAGDHPLSGLVRQRIRALELRELEAEARAAWREIERRAGTGKLPEAKAKKILGEIAAFEKEYGETKFAAQVARDTEALRERAGQSAERWIRIPVGRIKVDLHGGATSWVDGETLSVTAPAGTHSRAKIPLLATPVDFRLRFAYAGPMLEMFLRKRHGWRGCLLILLSQNAIGVRTYPVEDDHHPQALTLNKGRDVLPAGWHTVDLAMKGSSFALSVDGKAVTRTDALPFIAGGESYILVWNTQGQAFQLRDVTFAVEDEPSGTVAGVLLTRGKAGDWIDVKADGERFGRRYIPLEDAPSRFDQNAASRISKLFSPNRITLAWKLVGGERRVTSFQMHLLQDGDAGADIGTVTDAGRNWFELTPPDGRRERYIPRWTGGMPAAGGGPEKAVAHAISRLSVGDRIRVDWVYDIRKRAVKIAPAPR